jgi:uncharacterized protein YbjT (DUF2867 family)
MRVFLTGGTGYVGSAVLDAFVRAGHHVDALVRHREKAAIAQSRGATRRRTPMPWRRPTA